MSIIILYQSPDLSLWRISRTVLRCLVALVFNRTCSALPFPKGCLEGDDGLAQKGSFELTHPFKVAVVPIQVVREVELGRGLLEVRVVLYLNVRHISCLGVSQVHRASLRHKISISPERNDRFDVALLPVRGLVSLNDLRAPQHIGGELTAL